MKISDRIIVSATVLIGSSFCLFPRTADCVELDVAANNCAELDVMAKDSRWSSTATPLPARTATDTSRTHSMDERCASAREIIEGCKSYSATANILIAQANEHTINAKRLNGAAKQYGSTFVPVIRPLKGAKLAAARQMFKSDLEQFAKHVSEYREHNANVRHQFGECAASRAAYERNKNSYLLHTREFHIEDLPPPHICVTMEMAMSDASSASGRLKDSMKRMVDSQIELMKTESRLQAALRNSAHVDEDVRKQHALNLQEQDLAVEFARLQEENRQLEIEKRTLSASGVRTIIPTVHAKVQHK